MSAVAFVYMQFFFSETEIQCNMAESRMTYFEEEVIRYGCGINYRGSWAPLIECDLGIATNSESSASRVAKTVAIVASQKMNNSTIRCDISFEDSPKTSSNIETTYSTVVPRLKSTWFSSVIHVTR